MKKLVDRYEQTWVYIYIYIYRERERKREREREREREGEILVIRILSFFILHQTIFFFVFLFQSLSFLAFPFLFLSISTSFSLLFSKHQFFSFLSAYSSHLSRTPIFPLIRKQFLILKAYTINSCTKNHTGLRLVKSYYWSSDKCWSHGIQAANNKHWINTHVIYAFHSFCNILPFLLLSFTPFFSFFFYFWISLHQNSIQKEFKATSHFCSAKFIFRPFISENFKSRLEHR